MGVFGKSDKRKAFVDEKPTMPKNPTFSIIITSYNRPRLVADAIIAARQQTFDDVEIIVADDDSNDMTKGSIYAAADNDPRVRIFWSPRTLDPAERVAKLRYCVRINEVIPELRGQFVTYCCDDDFLYPRAVQLYVAKFATTPEAHVVYGRLRSISYDVGEQNSWNTQAPPISGRTFPKFGEHDPAIGKIVNDASWQPDFFSPFGGRLDHNQVAHRVECYKELGAAPWWPEGMENDVGDAAFFRRLDGLGHKAFSIDELVVSKRYHGRNHGKSGTSPVRE